MQIGNPQNIYAFQAEFTAIFKQLLSQAYPHLGYQALPEAKQANQNGRHRQRLDILLRGDGKPIYLLVTASMRDFVSRSRQYSVLHDCAISIFVQMTS